MTLTRLPRALLVALTALVIACTAEPVSPTAPEITPTLPIASQPVPVTPEPAQTPVVEPEQTTQPTSEATAEPAPEVTPEPTPAAQPTPFEPPGTPSPPRSFEPDTGLASDLAEELQAALDAQQSERNIPGIGAAVIFPDGSIWTSGSGDAILDPQEAATGDTPFVVGSITKTFIAATVMQLADAGQLSLDDPLSNWLPDYPDAENITIRQLLGHKSGIYNYFEAPDYDLKVFGTMKGHSWTPQEILDTFVGDPYFAPGEGYHYSNTGFILLGLVIEQITGQSVGDVLAQRFFGPLGLDETTFQGSGPPPSSAAEGYLLRASGMKEQSDGTDYRPTISAATVAWAAGAIDASARDIAVWGDALYGGHVVSPEALAQMEDWTYYPQADETYGLGTRSRVIEDERVFGHTGSIRGFDAAMWHFPETDMTIVALANRGRIDANPIVDDLAAVAVPAARGAGAAGPASRLRLVGLTRNERAVAAADPATLQAVLDSQRDSLHIPGISAAVIYPDGSIWKGNSGSSQLDPDALSTAKTPYVVGSITKTFVAAAVMQLADEGKLSIDDPLAHWLPDYPRADQMTLRQLLSHTSGVYNYFEHPKYNKKVFQTLAGHYWTPQEILDTFVKDPYFAPGAGYHYSNTGYVLLGLVLEKITGLPLGKVIKRRFFKPLGLRHTYFQGLGPPPSSSAEGFLYKDGTWKEWSDSTGYRPTISAASVAWAAGGVVANARDAAKWARALYGGSVVSADALEEMTGSDYTGGANIGYGLGTMMRISNGLPTLGHNGSLRGYDAAMWFYPDSGLTVVVLTNLGRISLNSTVDALAAAAMPPASARHSLAKAA